MSGKVLDMSIFERLLAFDCDGVILNFDKSFQLASCNALGRDVKVISNEYDLHKRYNMTEDEVYFVFEEMKVKDFGWGSLVAYQGAVEAVNQLLEDGFRLVMVTGIDEKNKSLRESNLRNVGVVDGAFEEIYCVGTYKDGVHQSKDDILSKLKPIVFIDDRLHLLNESPYIEERVWIDHGDTQTGHMEDGIKVIEDVATWVSDFRAKYAEEIEAKKELNRKPRKALGIG